MQLSDQQVDQFTRQGYWVIEDFLSREDCRVLMAEMDRIIASQTAIPEVVFSSQSNDHAKMQYFLDSADKIHFFMEPKARADASSWATSLNKVGHGLHVLNPVFAAYSADQRIKSLAHQLGIRQIGLAQSMYIFKQAGIGAEVVCHQDSSYLFGADSDALGFWFALEDATLDNGCLEVLPGPIDQPLKRQEHRIGNEIQRQVYDNSPWDESSAIPLPVRQGTLIMLHGRLPHKSKANLSNKTRHAYALHMVDLSKPFPKENWLRWPNGVPEL